MSVTIARRLRRAMSPPERRLWSALRNRPEGFIFRKQHPVGPFVLDFFYVKAALAIEVDGSSHFVEGAAGADSHRDRWLADNGVSTIRVLSTDVRDNF